MQKFLLPLVFFALTINAFADPPTLSIPSTINAPVNKWLVVTPNTTARAVIYVGLDNLEPFPSTELKHAERLVCFPTTPGSYRFVAIGVLNDEVTQVNFTIVVGTGPGPGPGPGPDPTDPLYPMLKAAFAQDGGRAADAKVFASVYRNAGMILDDGNVKTVGDVANKIHIATEGVIPGRLKATRTAVGNELNAQLKLPVNTLLNDDIRSKCRVQFARIGALLDFLGGQR